MSQEKPTSVAGSTPLPNYENPPLEEVVLGVQFEHLKNFSAALAGIFWNKIRDRYPTSEDQPQLFHQKEFPELRPSQENQLIQVPLSPRNWFISRDKTELIQVQRDRFVRNWRRIKGNETYPRFGQLFGQFKRDWMAFLAFAKEEGLGEVKIDQCELNYVNHLEKGSGWDAFSEIGKVFSFVKPSSRSGLLVEPESLSWSGAFKLPNDRGRLTVDINPAFRGRDFKMILSMSLSARGSPAGETTEAALPWFEMAHEWIVRAFDDLTEPAMHSLWKKLP